MIILGKHFMRTTATQFKTVLVFVGLEKKNPVGFITEKGFITEIRYLLLMDKNRYIGGTW